MRVAAVIAVFVVLLVAGLTGVVALPANGQTIPPPATPPPTPLTPYPTPTQNPCNGPACIPPTETPTITPTPNVPEMTPTGEVEPSQPDPNRNPGAYRYFVFVAQLSGQ